MDRKEAVTILQEKRDLARMLEAAEESRTVENLCSAIRKVRL